MIICYTVPEIWCMMDVIIFYFRPFFVLLPPPLTAQKIKIKKKHIHTHQNTSSLYTSVPKIMIICYTVSEIWCVTDVIVIFHSGLFCVLLPHPPPLPNSPKTQNFFKKIKKRLQILSFYICVPMIR